MNVPESKFNLILLFFLFIPITAVSQKVEITGDIYYAGYSMNEIKSLQEETRKQSTVPLRIMKNFPNFWGYDGLLGFKLSKRYILSFYFGITSTGSRLAYSDYSGTLHIDSRLLDRYGGIKNEFKLNGNKGFDLLFGLSSGISRTHFGYNTDISLNDKTTSSNLEFVSWNIHIVPGLGVKKNIKFIFIKFEARYELDITGKIRLLENSRLYLLNKSNQPMGVQWDGFRLAAGFGFNF